MALDIDFKCKDSWEDLVAEKVNYVVWAIGGDARKPSLSLLASGTGGFTEMKSHFQPDSLLFGGFRVLAVDVKRGLRSVRPRVVGFKFAGTATTTIKRARLSSFQAAIRQMQTNTSATFELVGVDADSFTMERLSTFDTYFLICILIVVCAFRGRN